MGQKKENVSFKKMVKNKKISQKVLLYDIYIVSLQKI